MSNDSAAVELHRSGISGFVASCFAILQKLPWLTLMRHLTAALFYLLVLVQWPGSDLSLVHVAATRLGLTTTAFTLLFWCACFYHYMISAGRVDVDWFNGRFQARGWLVKTSRRTHRVILVFSLAVSSAAVIQTSTFHALISSPYQFSGCPDFSSTTLTSHILKIDFVLSLLFTIYIGVRLSVEPIGLLKRSANLHAAGLGLTRTPSIRNTDAEAELNSSVKSFAKSDPHLLQFCKEPECVEECSICLQRVADRQANCGHLLCSCCLLELLKHSDQRQFSCPYCRKQVCSVREICLTVSDDFIPLSEYYEEIMSKKMCTTCPLV